MRRITVKINNLDSCGEKMPVWYTIEKNVWRVVQENGVNRLNLQNQSVENTKEERMEVSLLLAITTCDST